MSRPAAASDPPARDSAVPPAAPYRGAGPASGLAGSSGSLGELRRFGRRYPATGRAAVSVLCAAAGPFAAPPAGVGPAAVVAVAVVGWNLVYLRSVLPDGRPWSRYRRTYAVDLTLLCGLCLAQPLLVDPALLVASLGWVSPVASFTVVAVQFQLRSATAAVATAAVCLSYVAGAAASPGLTVGDGLAAGGAWMVVEAALARMLWRLLLRGGYEADRLMRARFAAERDAATAAARRAGQRAHWATVHDTSASTLLMVGLGQVSGNEEWLPGQVRRDIAMLDGRHEAGGGDVDLEPPLRAAAERARVRVALDCPAGVCVPARVAAALTGAVTEALENVHRHAGTGTAIVGLRGGGPVPDGGGAGAPPVLRVEVVVVDAGRGFDPAAVAPQRFGLAWSVHDRMDAVGGRAEVESGPGRGTVVRLRWPA